jgi:uncharacterized protein (UPF0210 family)
MPNPKIRAIAAFIRLERARWEQQIAETLAMLHGAKILAEDRGYPVESVRITTQPFPEYIRGLSKRETLAFLHQMDELAVRTPFELCIGPAMMRDADDPAPAALLGEALCTARLLQANLSVAGVDGVHPRAIRAAADLVRYAAENSPRSQGPFNFTATAMLRPFSPFYPGSFHDGPGRVFSIGLESASVVDEVFERTGGDARRASQELAEALAFHSRAMEAAGRDIENDSGWGYAGFDPTPAPLLDVSIGAAIEKFTGVRFGSSGTLAAAALITAAVEAVPVKRVGYSGLMLPVLEDSRIAQRWSEGAVSLDALLAYSAVCATGLDTIPLPGDVSVQQLERIYGDVAALAMKWKKPLTARLQPVVGKKAGERSEFSDPFLTNAVLQPLP